MAAPGYRAPSKKKMFLRGLTGRCCVCGTSRLKKTWIHVVDRCRECDFPIERKEGHFIGAVGMNTIVTFAFVLISLILLFLFGGTEPPVVPAILVLSAGVLLLSIGFFPISKTLWSAIDLMMIPIEPGEVDPRYDLTDYVETKDGA